MNPSGMPVQNDPLLRAYMVERLLWLIGLRWIAIVGIVVVVSVATASGLIRQPLPLLLGATFMVFYNLTFWQWVKTNANQAEPETFQKAVFLQVMLDLLVLTMLVHLSGCVENPFVLFFAFHMAIAAMLLPLRMALYLGGAASALHGLCMFLEWAGVVAHHSLRFSVPMLETPLSELGLWRSPYYVFGHLVAFVLMLFGVIYFVHSIAARYRQAEAQRLDRERVALSRERLARIGEISSGVAHTIRNPLHGVLNCIDILRARGGEDRLIQDTLSLMSEGLQRIEHITGRLLALTREGPLCRASTHLPLLIEEALRFVEVQSQKKRVTIRTHLEEVPAVEIDPVRFSEALINVLDNAIDACSDGSTITVKTFCTNGAKPFVHVQIQDSGKGIAPEHVDRVFDPFFTTKPVGKGSGLGLAITRRIVEEHGGEISVQSSADKGTRVSVSIPIRRKESCP